MDPIFELAIGLPPRGSGNLSEALQRQLRAAILDGRLKPGLRLPSTRTMAGRLGISRNTVVAAYDLLLSEGHLVGRQGAGTFVAEQPRPLVDNATPVAADQADERLAPFWRDCSYDPAFGLEDPGRFNFRRGVPDQRHFPIRIWRRLSARVLHDLSKEEVATTALGGRLALREAIAKHVSLTRAVACTAEDVIITAGTRQAFDLIARILVRAERTMVALENPTYPPLLTAFAAAGAQVVPVPVDAEGLVVGGLPAAARIVWVTPSHQWPLGVVMPPHRRAALLAFAENNGAVVIEDDYDGEFRFAGKPIEALQTLDRNGSVIYVGTFSKSLLPELRLGFIVAPAWARKALVTVRQVSGGACWLHQETLAAFIAEGHLATHVRKMRKVYEKRRLVLLNAIARHCAGQLRPLRPVAGLHLSAILPPSIDAQEVAKAAAEMGVGIYPITRYAVAPSDLNGLVFSYGHIETDEIEEAVRLLARAIGAVVSAGSRATLRMAT